MPKKTYSEADRERIITFVCEQIAEKRFLSAICREEEVPNINTILRWCSENPSYRREYERAREVALIKMLEETIPIADDASTDAYLAYNDRGEPYAKIDGDCVRRAALRINARERHAQLMAPHLYGNKVDITSGGEKLPPPAPTLVVTNRVEALLVLAAQRMGQGPPMIDITPDAQGETLDEIMD